MLWRACSTRYLTSDRFLIAALRRVAQLSGRSDPGRSVQRPVSFRTFVVHEPNGPKRNYRRPSSRLRSRCGVPRLGDV
jgi:hypothetical protein